MLTAYIEAAMHYARCEWLADDGVVYCEIPPLPGVWASGDDEACTRVELQEVLEGWIALGLARHDSLPAIDGLKITVEAVR